MKVSHSTTIDLPPPTVWAHVRTASLLQHIAWPLVRFIPVDRTAFSTFESGGRYQVNLRLFGLIPFGTQWIVTSLHEPERGDWPKRLRDNGYSPLIEKWDHWITIAPDGQGGTRYTDDVEILAGLMTPFVWAFAQMFYRHRQRRWRGLARTLHARNLIVDEMMVFRAARERGDDATAWAALERAHIVSQPYLGPHLVNHWAMLGFATAKHKWGEAIGQIARLALAPVGTLTGRIPVGNTGRSNVSPFAPMDIPEDLQTKINGSTK